MESELARSQEFLLRAFDSSLLALLPHSYDLLVPTETTNAEQSWSAAQGVIYKVSKSEIGAFLRMPIRVET